MKIKRNINGQEMEFELTGNEMWKAYLEQDHLFNMEDVRSFLAEWGDDDKPMLTEDQIERAADYVIEGMDGDDMVAWTRWNFLRDAIQKVMKEDEIREEECKRWSEHGEELETLTDEAWHEANDEEEGDEE